MKHIFHSLLLALFLSPLLSKAQVKVGYQNRINKDSKVQIEQLYNGALFVRLHNKAYSIQALKDAGRVEDANKIEAKQKAVNKEIVASFTKGFDFCPVYFFNSSDSKKIYEGKISEIGFLNNRLEVDSSIKCDKQYYFVAEFASIEQDTAGFYDRNYLEWDEKGPKIRQYRSGGGPITGIKALVVRSNEFIQLKRPFPYFVKENKVFIKRDKLTMVQLLNNELKAYHSYSKL